MLFCLKIKNSHKNFTHSFAFCKLLPKFMCIILVIPINVVVFCPLRIELRKIGTSHRTQSGRSVDQFCVPIRSVADKLGSALCQWPLPPVTRLRPFKLPRPLKWPNRLSDQNRPFKWPQDFSLGKYARLAAKIIKNIATKSGRKMADILRPQVAGSVVHPERPRVWFPYL
jgi:hypothetical protein